MKRMYYKPLMTGVIATLVAAPGWAIAEPTQTPGADKSIPPGQTMYELQTQPVNTLATQGVYAKTPKELHGMEVLGTNGAEIGTLKEIVARRDARQISAVISVGGILGVVAKEIVVPLDELRLQGDRLHILATKDDLLKREVYAVNQYRQVQPEDQPISEFSAFEEMPRGDAH